MTEPDYLPLAPGLRFRYALNRAQKESALLVEHLPAAGDGVIVRRTWTESGGASETETSRAERRPDGIYDDGVLALPLPARAGAAWSSPPRQYRIEAGVSAARTPAGEFKDCLRVSYLIAGGDGGSGERLYAPGVGLVLETCHDEADPFEAALLSFSRAAVGEGA
ncbi:MAG: hypothetical protein KGL74_02355 [Elusimicrobia bacterium]|nr:hypothetical protein [Elusimicrobiota bacterium]